MAKVVEKQLSFMGKKVASVHVEGGPPFDQAHVAAITNDYRLQFYSDGTARLFHKRFLRGTADAVSFNNDGTIKNIQLADGIIKGYEILATSKDGTYQARKKGSGTWKEPKDVFGENAMQKRVLGEIKKAWEFYERVAEHVPAFQSNMRVREELIKIAPPEPWKEVARGGAGTFIVRE